MGRARPSRRANARVGVIAAEQQISLAGFAYSVGATLAGEHVEVVLSGGPVEILPGVLGRCVAAMRRPVRPARAACLPAAIAGPAASRDATTGLTVIRIADGDGVVSVGGAPSRASRAWAAAAEDP